MPQIWIEWTDEDGDEGGARWGDPLPESHIDAVIAAATDIIGRGPDTVASQR